MMKTTTKSKPKFSKANLEDCAKLEKFIRHVRNLSDLGPHYIRAEAVDANDLLERIMGNEYKKIFQTKEWKS
jgi:hypothetical protein